MLENKHFVADIKSGQKFQVTTPDGDLTDTHDVSVGYLRGTNRQIKAIVCDGANENEPWSFFNVVDEQGYFNDYVAIIGASSPEQAERLSRKHFTFDSALTFKQPITITDNSLRLFLDAAFTPSRTDFLLEPDVTVFDSMITKEAAVWNDQNELESHDGYLANLILDMVKYDLGQELVTKVSNRDIIEMLIDDKTEILVADAMIMQYRQLDLAVKRLTEALKNAGDEEFFIKTVTPIEPFKRFGVVNVGVIFEMSDDQRITVLFNNPDSTPSKLMPSDVITSWKWILNKRDVTAILQPRAVEAKRYPIIAQRMFKLLAKNHARFKRLQLQKMRDEQLLNELINQLEAQQSMSRQLDKTLAELSQQIDEFAAQKQIAADEQIKFITPLKDQEIPMKRDSLGVQVTAPVVEGDEFGDFELPEALGDLRAAVKEKMLEMVGRFLPCPALGGDVEIRKSGIKKIMSKSADVRKLIAIAVLDQLLVNAKKIEEKPPYNGADEQNIKAYHILSSVFVLDGAVLYVRFVIREDDKGHYHYDHTINAGELENAKSPLLDGLSAADFPMAGVSQEELVKPIHIATYQLVDSIKNNQDEVNPLLDDANGSAAVVLNMFIVDETEDEDANTAFLNDVISGNVDLSADDTGAKLEEIGASLEGTNEQLFNEAVNAYVNFALNNAQSLTNA